MKITPETTSVPAEEAQCALWVGTSRTSQLCEGVLSRAVALHWSAGCPATQPWRPCGEDGSEFTAQAPLLSLAVKICALNIQ